MIKITLFFLMAFISQLIFAQSPKLIGTYIAEASNRDPISQNQQLVNHTLLLKPDKSFIYKKTHLNTFCNYNYIGSWNESNNELILSFLEDEQIALKIIKGNNSELLFIEKEELLLHPINPSKMLHPLKQLENNKNKKYKDPPCPKF